MITEEEVDNFLEHVGIKGMHWGQRQSHGGVSRSTNRAARKDAEEFARAKMFFGEGAGTRRKLINKSVEAKKARDPAFAKAFDTHLAKQDLSKHASGAKKERKRTDRSQRTKKQAGAVARRLTGEMGTQAALVALVAGGGAFLASPKGRQVMSTTMNRAKNLAIGEKFIRQRRAKRISDFINMGPNFNPMS